MDFSKDFQAAREFLVKQEGWYPMRVELVERVFGPAIKAGRSLVSEIDDFGELSCIRVEAFVWICAVLKSHLGIPFDAPTAITELIENGKCHYSALPAAELVSARGKQEGLMDSLQNYRQREPDLQSERDSGALLGYAPDFPKKDS